MPELPCNCFHSKQDHKNLGTMDDQPFYTWCRYSEIGQCPCDYFTEMDNLTYLEVMNDERERKTL